MFCKPYAQEKTLLMLALIAVSKGILCRVLVIKSQIRYNDNTRLREAENEKWLSFKLSFILWH